MLTRQEKETEVQELNEKFSRATSVFLADYRGLDVKATDDLRQKLREGAGDGEPFEYHVGKNSLLRRAVEGSDASPLADFHIFHDNGLVDFRMIFDADIGREDAVFHAASRDNTPP